MHWWDALTPGQGALLGGLAVLAAGLTAFTSGWFDRRATQRRYHYEEVKRVFRSTLQLSNTLTVTSKLSPPVDWNQWHHQYGQVLAEVTAELSLTASRSTTRLALEHLVYETKSRTNPPGEPDATPHIAAVEVSYMDLLYTMRDELSDYLPSRSRHARVLRERLPSDLERAAADKTPPERP